MASHPTIWRLPPAERTRHLGTDVGHFLRQLDYVLLAAVAGLVAYGLWIVQSVTGDDLSRDPDFFLTRQSIFVAIGAVAFVAATAISPELWRRLRAPLFAVALALMVVVFVVGPSIRGSRRWIDLGSFQLQPSEIGKIALIVFVAGFLADRARHVESGVTVAGAVGIGLVPILLVFFEPDFGTALVTSAALAGALVFAGVRLRHLTALGVLAAGIAVSILWALPSAGIQVLKPYQLDRLVGFLHPDSDPSGTTYNINQSITAVGSGGLDGRGVAGATQTNLDYLPEHATDFIFASLSEQRGFLGASILLLLYALLVWRGIKIVAAFLFQDFLNVGMTIGIAPVTGIPLPFVSYGGSSMITSLVAIGMLQSIHARGRLSGR